jgi:molybdate transport system substrate-binding protein
LGITVGGTARAADIKLLSASALHPAIDALIPEFEKSSEHKVTVAYGTAGAVADRVEKGEAADLIISSVPMIDRLQAKSKVVAGQRAVMAKVGVGAFVRKGAAKPNIKSVKYWLNPPSNSSARCRQRFRTTPSSLPALLPKAIKLKPQGRWSRSFPRPRR